MWNNVVYNFPNGGSELPCIDLDQGVGYVFNNTVYDCQVGIIRYSAYAGIG